MSGVIMSPNLWMDFVSESLFDHAPYAMGSSAHVSGYSRSCRVLCKSFKILLSPPLEHMFDHSLTT
jgi:hypothetical protein